MNSAHLNPNSKKRELNAKKIKCVSNVIYSRSPNLDTKMIFENVKLLMMIGTLGCLPVIRKK